MDVNLFGIVQLIYNYYLYWNSNCHIFSQQEPFQVGSWVFVYTILAVFDASGITGMVFQVHLVDFLP